MSNSVVAVSLDEEIMKLLQKDLHEQWEQGRISDVILSILKDHYLKDKDNG